MLSFGKTENCVEEALLFIIPFFCFLSDLEIYSVTAEKALSHITTSLHLLQCISVDGGTCMNLFLVFLWGRQFHTGKELRAIPQVLWSQAI